MRKIIPLFFIAAAVLVGCHSPSRVHTQTAGSTVAARPSFRPMLITTLGTNISSDGTWRIGVLETSLDLTHLTAQTDGMGFRSSGSSTVSPQGWRAQAGWFVFIESESRVWAYDGDRKLLLQTETVSGNSSTGATYSTRYPCPVPNEVFARLLEPAQRAIRTNE
jgi:hypothetical protein